ncbi:MAG: hypothetical protein ACRDNT_27575 [Streptosporangiaceae bacterium]
MHDWAARNGARQGTPILVGPSGVADARINLFFRIGTVAARRPRTWRRYAYSLLVWLDFPGGPGPVVGRGHDGGLRCLQALEDDRPP